MAFDRSKYKATNLKVLQQEEEEVQALIGYDTTYHKIEEGRNIFRLYPAHGGSKIFIRAKVSHWLPVELERNDKIEWKRLPVPHAKKHGGQKEDLVEQYIAFVRKMVKGDVNIAVLNFAENEWSTASSDKPGANPINPISNFNSINITKESVDIVIVITHGGHEMYRLPSPRMKELYRFYIDAGADIVINHHTHCTSGYEKYNGKFIFYSIGNPSIHILLSQ